MRRCHSSIRPISEPKRLGMESVSRMVCSSAGEYLSSSIAPCGGAVTTYLGDAAGAGGVAGGVGAAAEGEGDGIGGTANVEGSTATLSLSDVMLPSNVPCAPVATNVAGYISPDGPFLKSLKVIVCAGETSRSTKYVFGLM